MKKYGKYEKMPDGTRAKQPPVKNMLLQTYFTSLLCMVLCVTMFFGTSYAWFTSEVNNVGNEIYIGTLDVGLYKQDGADLSKTGSKLFDGNIRWEPGYTSLETIKIVNEGDLAFKYALNFTSDDTAVEAVAQNFEVWVYDYYANGNAAPTYSSYTDINAKKGWDYVGTLADVLAGKDVLGCNMNTVRKSDLSEGVTAPSVTGIPDSVATVDTYTIALHMKEDTCDATLMGKKITLNVKLVAYQNGSEQDAFGNAYDDKKFVSTEKEFISAMENPDGGTVVLMDDINATDCADVVGDVTLDMNGHTITDAIEHHMLIYVRAGGKLTITGNGTISKESHTNNMIYADGEIIIMNGTYEIAPYTWGTDCKNTEGNCHCWIDGKGKVDHHCDNPRRLGSIICGRNDESNVLGSVKIYGGYFNTGILNPEAVDVYESSQITGQPMMYPMFNCAEDREKGVITIYGGQFVDADPTGGDANAPAENFPDAFFLYGQTEKWKTPAGYTIATEDKDGHTVYTVTYTDPS